MRSLLPVSLAAGVLLGTACSQPPEMDKPVTKAPTTTTTAPAARFDAIPRLEFNRRAAELALPFFWIRDDNANKTLEPAEFAVLWGVSDQTRATFVDDKGAFTEMFRLAFEAMRIVDRRSQYLKAAAQADELSAVTQVTLNRAFPSLCAQPLKVGAHRF